MTRSSGHTGMALQEVILQTSKKQVWVKEERPVNVAVAKLAESMVAPSAPGIVNKQAEGKIRRELVSTLGMVGDDFLKQEGKRKPERKVLGFPAEAAAAQLRGTCL